MVDINREKESEITHDSIRELFSYNDGELYWNVDRTPMKTKGRIAGCLYPTGYKRVVIGRKKIFVHRVIWMYHYGKWPNDFVDHINGNRADNRIENLRCATSRNNRFNSKKFTNNTSGFTGVHWRHRERKWRAETRVNGVYKYLGSFSTPEEASQAYQDFAKKHHGEFYKEQQ